MRTTLFILALVLGLSTQAQVIINLAESPNAELIDSLDNAFSPAMNVDPEKAVMGDRPDAFKKEWAGFLKGFATYLNKNEFYWGKPTRSFLRLYSDEEGNVQYILYKLFADSLTEEQRDRFPELLEAYLIESPIPLAEPASKRFSQCGPVTFMDVN